MTADKGWTVYVLTVPNGKVYVGVTSRLLRKRWQYGYGYEQNKPFFADIQKYGWRNIRKEVLAEALTENEAYSIEKEAIKKYRSTDPEHGYNRAAGGFGTTGFYPDETSRKKMAESKKGKRHHCISVSQFSLDGKHMATYPSMVEASKITGIKYKSIVNCCSGVIKKAGGYIWRHTEMEEQQND